MPWLWVIARLLELLVFGRILLWSVGCTQMRFSVSFKSALPSLCARCDRQVGAIFLIMGSFVMGFVESTCEANKGLQYVFNLLPSYALGKGLVNVSTVCEGAARGRWGPDPRLGVYGFTFQIAFVEILPDLNDCGGGGGGPEKGPVSNRGKLRIYPHDFKRVLSYGEGNCLF